MIFPAKWSLVKRILSKGTLLPKKVVVAHHDSSLSLRMIPSGNLILILLYLYTQVNFVKKISLPLGGRWHGVSRDGGSKKAAISRISCGLWSYHTKKSVPQIKQHAFSIE